MQDNLQIFNQNKRRNDTRPNLTSISIESTTLLNELSQHNHRVILFYEMTKANITIALSIKIELENRV